MILRSSFHSYNVPHLILYECLHLWLKNACSVIIFMVKFSETQMFTDMKSEKDMGQAEVSPLWILINIHWFLKQLFISEVYI